MKLRKILALTAAVFLVLLLFLFGLALRYRGVGREDAPLPAESRAPENRPVSGTAGFLYGRIHTIDGATLEGRLRFGGAQESFWSEHFNGSKKDNPWRAEAPIDRLPQVHDPIRIFGFTLIDRVLPHDLRRPFMARFGDIERIDARGKQVLVTLKSGTVVVLDRFGASDFDDGIRVWDAERGVVDLDSLRVRTIEFLATPSLEDVPARLHGTVRTSQGEFTGFIQWNRTDCVGTDELRGRVRAEVDDQAAEGDVRLRFDTIRSIERDSPGSARVTLLDGRELVLSGPHLVGDGNRPGVSVEDRRYGGVLIPWEVFERLDFTPGGSGPAYGDFTAAHPLRGTVVTRAGRRLRGRLVYDLDESETNETLDAPSRNVNYNIPFGSIASVVLHERGDERVSVTLRHGEVLRLEREGDLAETNTGFLVFDDGEPDAEFVPWSDVARVDFDRPPAANVP